MPDWRAAIRRRLRPLALAPTREVEIVEELAQHLEDRYAEGLALGACEKDAAARAWRELDAEGALETAIRRVESPLRLDAPPAEAPPGGRWIVTLWLDIRYSVRTLGAAPAFSLTVLVAIVLSIAPVTAILSVANWLLWRPLPGVTDARSLGEVWFGRWTEHGAAVSFSPSGVPPELLTAIRSGARSIDGIAGVEESTSSLSVRGRLPRQAGTAVVTADFFDVLGIRLSAGRSFTADEDEAPAGAPVVVVSQALAKSAFGSPAAALGQSITLNSRPFSIIGVAPPAFAGISNTGGIDAWLTAATWRLLNHVAEPRSIAFYSFVVRVAAGATFDDVEKELTALSQAAGPRSNPNEQSSVVRPRVFSGLGLMPLTRASTRRMVATLLSVGGVLLLLGCANVANLLMFRAARRQHEIAIRKALGATRFRLLQLQLMESWLLASTGALAGLALAVHVTRLIERLLVLQPSGSERGIPIDIRVLALTIAIALVTGGLAAMGPGWLLTRSRSLSFPGRTTLTCSRAPKLRSGLAILQLALSLTLLVGALLLVSTLRNLRGIELGLDPGGVTVLTFDVGEHGYDARRALAYHREVLPGLQATGEFADVSLSTRAPFASRSSVPLIPPGGDAASPLSVGANGISGGYFRVLSIPLVRGRVFTSAEALAGEENGLVIVNERLARQLFHTTDVLDRTIRLAPTAGSPPRDLTIIGVAGDSRWRYQADDPEPFLYQSFGQFRSRGTSGVYMIKSNLPAPRAGEIANAIAARTASGIPLSAARPLTSGIDRELSRQRMFAWMLSLLAAVGFVLAALGLYGVIAQTTAERRRELGIRLALGAGTADIVRLVARQAVLISLLGVLLGLCLSYFASGLIQHLLFGVSPLEPLVYLAAAATLTLVVGLACLDPALRALRVPAVDVLKAE